MSMQTNSERKRVALIWPKGFDPHIVMPLSLGYLKSNLDTEKYDVRLFDNALRNYAYSSDAFSEELKDFNPDVVGVSAWSPMFEETLNIVRLAKALNSDVVTVGGGAHISSYSHKVMAHLEFDFVFRGEGDLSFGVFLDQLFSQAPNWDEVLGLTYRGADGNLVNNPTEKQQNLDIIKIPDYGAMDLEGYHEAGYRWNTRVAKNAPLWVTRGCPYRCTFCAAPVLNGKPVRTHSIEYMVDWVEFLYHQRGVRWLNIIDDNFTYDKKFAKAFCRAMIDLNLPDLKFGTPNGIRMSRGDVELWGLLKQAGWETIIVAPESGSQDTLATMKKDLDLAIVPRIVNELRDAGLKVQAFFILGYPGETMEDIKKTSKFITDCRFNFIFMNNFQPLPGTPVYDDLVSQGKIEDGLMPINYSDGVRVYTPPGLENFNFPMFVLKKYLSLMLRDPLNIPYMIRLYRPLMLAKKVGKNFLNMFDKSVKISIHESPKSNLMPTARV